MALSLDIKLGGSLWSAAARDTAGKPSYSWRGLKVFENQMQPRKST